MAPASSAPMNTTGHSGRLRITSATRSPFFRPRCRAAGARHRERGAREPVIGDALIAMDQEFARAMRARLQKRFARPWPAHASTHAWARPRTTVSTVSNAAPGAVRRACASARRQMRASFWRLVIHGRPQYNPDDMTMPAGFSEERLARIPRFLETQVASRRPARRADPDLAARPRSPIRAWWAQMDMAPRPCDARGCASSGSIP